MRQVLTARITELELEKLKLESTIDVEKRPSERKRLMKAIEWKTEAIEFNKELLLKVIGGKEVAA